MSTLRVVLADDHALVRAGVRSLLEALAGVQVVGEAADGREALRLIGELRPDLALIDIAMPGLNGLDVLKHPWVIWAAGFLLAYSRKAIAISANCSRVVPNSCMWRCAPKACAATAPK